MSSVVLCVTGDECVYFREGHERYFTAVEARGEYAVQGRDRPGPGVACECVKVVGLKFVERGSARVASLRVQCEDGRRLALKYHDVPDVIDFLVLKQQADQAMGRGWAAGDRFRCMIDDAWWTGTVEAAPPSGAPLEAAFLGVRVRWDNGEPERLSPWDLEPPDDRLPPEPGGGVPALPGELSALYRPAPADWPPRGDRVDACRALVGHVELIMSLAVAEPFLTPAEVGQRRAPYPVDLSTIRARFQNHFYRRAAAALFDARQLSAGAGRSRHQRAGRLVSQLLQHAVNRWWDADILAKYRELSALASRSARPVPAPPLSSAEWVATCGRVLREVCSSSDAEPFRAPVSPEMAPDYRLVVHTPCDFGTVRRRYCRLCLTYTLAIVLKQDVYMCCCCSRLESGQYAHAGEFCTDMRLVFSNSRLYNTNKRSRVPVYISLREVCCRSRGVVLLPDDIFEVLLHT